MRAYLYSGTLEGLFSTIFDIYTLKKLPDIIISDSSYQLGLENEIIYVKDDDEKVKRIENSIIKHMGPEGIRTFIYTCLLYTSRCV